MFIFLINIITIIVGSTWEGLEGKIVSKSCQNNKRRVNVKAFQKYKVVFKNQKVMDNNLPNPHPIFRC